MSTRLRSTFKYASDDTDIQDGILDDMDEEEQEKLITSFKTQNQSMNDMYIRAFTFLPLGFMPVFVGHFVAPSSIATVRLLSLLSGTSLLGSAFRMWFVPYSDEDAANVVKVRKIPWLDLEIDHDGPLGRFLPYLNMGICLVLVVSAWGVKDRKDVPAAFWMFLLVPAAVLVMVSVARQSMSDVDKGLGELGKLKYDYRGA